MNAVSFVTVKEKLKLYKKEEEATFIELITLNEYGFELVAQKDLYQIGDKAIYIQPDYNLSDISLFDTFIRPNGEERKSMLGNVNGKPRRIRAKKFNFSKQPNGEPVYSNGILLPMFEVNLYLEETFKNSLNQYSEEQLTEKLCITKYEEEEKSNGGGLKSGISKPFPNGLYKTDENNIHNVWGAIQFPITLSGTEKVDGSSITIGITPNDKEGFICSRNLRKPLTYNKVVGHRTPTFIERIKRYLFRINTDLKIYEEVESDSDFVIYGKTYLELLKGIHETNLVLRGELNGGHLKGSGNKYNPAKNEAPNIKFFGIDIVNESGIAKKLPRAMMKIKANELNLPLVKEVFPPMKFNSRAELIDYCNTYFKDNMIEGIVVRDEYSSFSAKIMNLEYDSKK
jgi:hypothetical protein